MVKRILSGPLVCALLMQHARSACCPSYGTTADNSINITSRCPSVRGGVMWGLIKLYWRLRVLPCLLRMQNHCGYESLHSAFSLLGSKQVCSPSGLDLHLGNATEGRQIPCHGWGEPKTSCGRVCSWSLMVLSPPLSPRRLRMLPWWIGAVCREVCGATWEVCSSEKGCVWRFCKKQVGPGKGKLRAEVGEHVWVRGVHFHAAAWCHKSSCNSGRLPVAELRVLMCVTCSM